MGSELLWLSCACLLAQLASCQTCHSPSACDVLRKQGSIHLQHSSVVATTPRPRAEQASSNSERASPFPRIVHVCEKNELDFKNVKGWMSKNPGYRLNKLLDPEVFSLVKEGAPEAYSMYENGTVRMVELTDLARLLALDRDGGIYVDSDVVDLKSIDSWLPSFGISGSVHMVLGVEFPFTGGSYPAQVQFTNFALGSVPNNPILQMAVRQIVGNLKSIGEEEGNEVIRTGPQALTSVVLEAIKDGGATLPPVKVLNAGQGRLLRLHERDGKGELRVALLPYRAFGFHPDHAELSDTLGTADHLVEHKFLGTWRPRKSVDQQVQDLMPGIFNNETLRLIKAEVDGDDGSSG